MFSIIHNPLQPLETSGPNQHPTCISRNKGRKLRRSDHSLFRPLSCLEDKCFKASTNSLFRLSVSQIGKLALLTVVAETTVSWECACALVAQVISQVLL